MKKAMITIEVLVSLLILFLVIATSFSNIKFFNLILDKKINYEDEYIAVLSIRDKLASSICQTSMREEGNLNNFSYTATCEKIKELRTFSKANQYNEREGNIGKNLIQLYKIRLKVTKSTFTKEHNYYITRNTYAH